MIKADHPIFSNYVPPVPALIEIPLVLHRVGTQSQTRAGLDNQIATYLNIDSKSGFAPPAWRSYVGTVLVARKDKSRCCPSIWKACGCIVIVFWISLVREKVRRYICIIDKHSKSGGKTIVKNRKTSGWDRRRE
jgi:hypothetical protein